MFTTVKPFAIASSSPLFKALIREFPSNAHWRIELV